MKKRKQTRSADKKNSSRNSTSGRASRDRERGECSPYRVGFAVLVVLLATVLAYQLVPSKYTGKTKESRNRDAINTPSGEEGGGSLEGGSQCMTMIEEARRVVESSPPSEWDRAVGLLAECIRREPTNSVAYWSLAVTLLRRGNKEDGTKFMSEAIHLDPENTEYLKSSGLVFASLEMYSPAIFSLERYLELALQVTSWEELLASISMQREDELEFIHDAGEDVVHILEVLQSAYLKEMSLVKAGFLYKVIIGLKGEEAEMDLLSSYAYFSLGLGDFVTGIKYLKLFTERQYMAAGYGTLEQAIDVVQAHALRLFTAGFETHISGIASNLLSGGSAVWEELAFNCGLEEPINFTTRVYLSDVKKIVMDCVDKQNIVKALLGKGAVVYADNLFGWTPLLHAAALGSPKMIELLLKNRADPVSRTGLAHTSLHIAAMRGSYGVVHTLLEAGVPPDEGDYFKRSPLKIACLHGWPAKEFAQALGRELPNSCVENPAYHPPPRPLMYGGWLPGSMALPEVLIKEHCDFDVVNGLSAKEFLYDYLSLQRPVLVRNASNIHNMKKLHSLWHRNKIASEYRRETFKLHKAVQGDTMDQTTIKDFIENTKKFHDELKQISWDNPAINPMHITAQVPSESPFLKHFVAPSVLSDNITSISSLKFNIFLGTQLSGLSPKFHRSSWHLQVYGQNRWFLYPPTKAYTSNLHIWEWWTGSYRNSPDALECVQHSGDLLFIPETWGHGFISLREGIGLSSQFIYGASEFSI